MSLDAASTCMVRLIRGILAIGIVLSIGGCATQRPETFASGIEAAQRGDLPAAMEILERVAQEQEGTIQGALALDAMTDLAGRRLFPEKAFECGAEAIRVYDQAESSFAARRYEDALSRYQHAVELCPDNAVWWIHAGDALFHSGEYSRARDMYSHGLEIDPWNRSGHRFLSDAEANLGRALAAYRSAVLAVVADPTYEAGWLWLRNLAVDLGGEFHRVRGRKPNVVTNDGKPTMQISAAYDSQATLTSWLAYGLVRWGYTREGAAAGDEDSAPLDPTREEWRGLTPLEREKVLIADALDLYRNYVQDHPDVTSAFWGQMQTAVEAGFEVEAIYIHLMDRDLAPSYVEYRAEHHDRLIAYISELVAPIVVPGSREVRCGADESSRRR